MQQSNLISLDDSRAQGINYRMVDLEATLLVAPEIAEQPEELDYAVRWFVEQLKDEAWPGMDIWDIDFGWDEFVDEDGKIVLIEVGIRNPRTKDIYPFQLSKVMARWDESGYGQAASMGPLKTSFPDDVMHSEVNPTLH